MPDYRTMYDRDYIGHFDLPGGNDLSLTIKRVVGGELTAMGGRKSKKPIVHFQQPVKPLICNKTNSKTIAAMYGNMTEAWAGKLITLFVSTTRNPDGGGEVECIRIRPKVPQHASARLPVAAEPQDLAGNDEAAADAPSTAPPPVNSPAPPPLAATAGGATYLNPEQIRAILSLCEQLGVKAERVLLKAKVTDIEKILDEDYESCIKWIKGRAA